MEFNGTLDPLPLPASLAHIMSPLGRSTLLNTNARQQPMAPPSLQNQLLSSFSQQQQQYILNAMRNHQAYVPLNQNLSTSHPYNDGFDEEGVEYEPLEDTRKQNTAPVMPISFNNVQPPQFSQMSSIPASDYDDPEEYDEDMAEDPYVYQQQQALAVQQAQTIQMFNVQQANVRPVNPILGYVQHVFFSQNNSDLPPDQIPFSELVINCGTNTAWLTGFICNRVIGSYPLKKLQISCSVPMSFYNNLSTQCLANIDHVVIDIPMTDSEFLPFAIGMANFANNVRRLSVNDSQLTKQGLSSALIFLAKHNTLQCIDFEVPSNQQQVEYCHLQWLLRTQESYNMQQSAVKMQFATMEAALIANVSSQLIDSWAIVDGWSSTMKIKEYNAIQVSLDSAKNAQKLVNKKCSIFSNQVLSMLKNNQFRDTHTIISLIK